MIIKKMRSLVKKKGLVGLAVKLSERIRYKAATIKYMREKALTDEEYERQSDITEGKDVLISVCVPVFNPVEEHFRAMLESVVFQSYGNWELCIADGSTNECDFVRKIIETAGDSRIRYNKLDFNMGIVGNSNEAVTMASGEYIALLDHDDVLSLDALFELKKAIDQGADFIYSDEASFSKSTVHPDIIHFKPDYSMLNLRGNNYICHLSCFKKQLFERCGGFRDGFDGSQDHDLIIRLCEKAERIYHIRRVLYFWRVHAGSVAMDISAKPYCVVTGKRAVESHLKRMKLSARVETPTNGAHYVVRYASSVEPTMLNSISNINGVTADYIVVARRGIVTDNRTINELAQYIWQDNVGLVSAMAIKDKHISSAGLRVRRGTLVQAQRGTSLSSDGYMHILNYAHEITAADGYCFAIRRSALERAGGFDESLPENERVPDMCFRLRELGYSIVLNPYARVQYEAEDINLSYKFRRKWRVRLTKGDEWLRDEVY
jgi:glycosyltransferase involved in cell wall biosynthesis